MLPKITVQSVDRGAKITVSTPPGGVVRLDPTIPEALTLRPPSSTGVLGGRVTALEAETAAIEAALSFEHRHYEQLTISSDRQTVFALLLPPAVPPLVQLFLDGEKAVFGVDFVIDGLLLTWLSPVPLATNEQLELYY